MSWTEAALVVAVVLLLALWWVWVAASRLDRLHRKVATSRAALDNQLVRRASVTAEMAASGLLDPVSSLLVAEASWAALSAGGAGRAELAATLPDLEAAAAPQGTFGVVRPDDALGRHRGPADRELAESELSRTVGVALADPEELDALRQDPLGAELVDALGAAWYRVQLARRFHNEAVAQTQRVRRKWGVRLLRLHGHAPVPHTVEIDDAWPPALRRPGDPA